MADYNFTSDWFSRHLPTWRHLIGSHKPKRLLEIGSWEGRSACFLIEECSQHSPIEIHCVDTWLGSVENSATEISDLEQRFDHNINVAIERASNAVRLHKYKMFSHLALCQLTSRGEKFDLIYVDGSHQAPDVLRDAVLSFGLLSVGGIMIFDDYLWSMEPEGHQDHHNMPKPAIDAFINIYRRKIRIFEAPLYQLYIEKRAE